MTGVSSRSRTGWSLRRRLARRAWLGVGAACLPWLGLACATVPSPVAQNEYTAQPTQVAGRPAEAGRTPAKPAIRPVVHQEPAAPAVAEPAAEGKVLPVSLDTVLRLAEEQNPQLAVARERLNQAGVERSLADSAWIPDIYVGTAYYRHEGGIQNEDGTLTHSSFGTVLGGLEMVGSLDLKEWAFKQVNAERQVWQQKGEVRRVTSETLLDAAGSYVDLLSARTGEVIAAELKGYEDKLLEHVESLAKAEPGTKVQLVAVQATATAHQQALEKLHQQGNAAGAKLAYLLGVGPCRALIPVDRCLAPFDLVDASPPCCDLVARATANGPGVHELECLLATIQNGIEEAKSSKRFIPVFEVRMLEAGFGAGPGADLAWDNRWDLGLAARFNLTDLLTAREKIRVAEWGLRQAQLSLQEVRARLAAGVQEAQDAILSGRRQLALADQQVLQAREAYNLSWDRLQNHVSKPGEAPGEVLQAIRALEAAQLNKIQIVRDYDKAELRLLILLNASGCSQ